jgi:hypothetical protein
MESSEVLVKEASKPVKPDSIEELIICMKERPGMYIRSCSLDEFCAFLSGWEHRSYETVTDIDIIGDFDKWVRKRYKMEKMEQSWDHIIRFWSLNEQGALKLFFELFDEFSSQRNKKQLQ